MKQLAVALLKAQSEMSNPKKGSSNPYFKSKYADLNSVREAVIPILNQNGIIVLQPMTSREGKNYIQTILMHESGEQIESLTEIIYSKTNDAQAQGSGITYARRYGLQSLVCVGADDDDGNKASEISKTKISPIKEAYDIATVISEIEAINNLDDLKAYYLNSPLKADLQFGKLINTQKAKINGKS